MRVVRRRIAGVVTGAGLSSLSRVARELLELLIDGVLNLRRRGLVDQLVHIPNFRLLKTAACPVRPAVIAITSDAQSARASPRQGAHNEGDVLLRCRPHFAAQGVDRVAWLVGRENLPFGKVSFA